MPVHAVAGPRLRGGGTAPLRASSAQLCVELVKKADEELGAYKRAEALEQWLGGREDEGRAFVASSGPAWSGPVGKGAELEKGRAFLSTGFLPRLRSARSCLRADRTFLKLRQETGK